MRKVISYFILILGGTCLLMLIISMFSTEDINVEYTIKGAFNETLSSVNTIEQIDSCIGNTGSMEEYTLHTDSILKLRFYHGTCRYNFSENWMAYVLGKYLWDDLRVITETSEILKYRMAVCNQINIVFQSLLENKGARYRTVGLNHHMITEVFYNEKWHAFDQDYEISTQGESARSLLESGRLREAYAKSEGKKFNNHFNSLLNTKELIYYEENRPLASNLRAFQKGCRVVSYFGWTLLLLPLLIKRLRP